MSQHGRPSQPSHPGHRQRAIKRCAVLVAGVATGVVAAIGGPLTGAAAQGQSCVNPYFPVSESAQWRYKAGMPALPILMSEDLVRFTDVSPAGFVQIREVGGNAGTLVRRWTCLPDGLSDTARTADVSASDVPNMVGTVRTADAAGVTLPSADQWQAGYTWKQTYSASFSGLDVVPGTQPSSSGDVETAHTILGQESVTVPAGTFNAWHIESTSHSLVTVEVSGVSKTYDVSRTLNSWYAENVGLVKSTDALDGSIIDQQELLTFTP